jgi:hypothetical protein
MPLPNPANAYGSYQMTSTSPYDQWAGQPAPTQDSFGNQLFAPGQPWWDTALTGLGIFVALGIGIHILSVKRGFPEDAGHLLPDGHSVVTTTICAGIGIMTLKFLTAKYQFPLGISPLVQTYL